MPSALCVCALLGACLQLLSRTDRWPCFAPPVVQVRAYIDEVMDIVDLIDIQYGFVGQPGLSGLSVEQRKRLTIAVELVAK